MSHQSQSPIRTPLEPRSRIVHEGRGNFSWHGCRCRIITPRGEKLQSPKAPGLKEEKVYGRAVRDRGYAIDITDLCVPPAAISNTI